MMNRAEPSQHSRSTGCLLGLAVGDAAGVPFEGRTRELITATYGTAEQLLQNLPARELYYSDDTQMAIGVAETLIECGEIDERVLCQRFAENYSSHRGYGKGARMILEAISAGHDHKYLAENYFPGGSYGNGGAMRVAPVDIYFRKDHDRLWEQARLSALPTHVHPLGIEGAQLLALAVGLASTMWPLDKDAFLHTLIARSEKIEFKGPLSRVGEVDNPLDLALFGNGIAAQDSVVTAIASFLLTPHSYTETIGNAIMLGGDTDTIAAMAGAISGAHLGESVIPIGLLDRLENDRQGRAYIEELAKRLWNSYQQRSAR